MTALPGGSPNTALDMIGYGNHLLLGNVTTSGLQDRFKVAWSDFLNGTIWTSGDALSADLVDGGDSVMGFALYGLNAQVFKTDSMYVVFPIPAPLFYEFDRRITYAGCIATASLQETPIGTISLWRNNLYVFDTIAGRELLGQKGQSIAKDLFATLNSSQIGATFSIKDIVNNRYILFIPTQAWTATAPVYKGYVYNWKYNTYSIYDFNDIPGGITGGTGNTGLNGHIFQLGRTFAGSTYGFNVSPFRFNDYSSQSAPTFLLGGSANGKAYRQPTPTNPVYTDDGNVYRSYVQTGLTDFGNAWPNRTMVKRMHVEQVAQTAGQVQTSLITSDDGSSQTLVGPFTETATQPPSIGVYVQQTHTYNGVQIDDNFSSSYWEAKRAIFEVEPDGER
jgi:hypothetical protein